MKMFIEELVHYNSLKRTAHLVGKPCIWTIVSVLMESEDKTINITSLISMLNSNYKTVSKCLDQMKRLNIIEEISIGRLRLVRLLDTPLTRAMTEILYKIREDGQLLFDERQK
uniref:ArsR family transcriptional regulator n=1 Tax=Ignisphaera aggregans TaxID=334771 RepID=A0A7C2VLU0_9CREN